MPGKRFGIPRTPRLTVAAALALVLGACLEPSTPGSLTIQLRGPVYPRPRCAKGKQILNEIYRESYGPFYPRGEPVADAQVVLTPGNHSGTTDATGKVVLKDIPAGLYRLEVRSPSFFPLNNQSVSIAAGETASLDLPLISCVYGGGDQYRVGFGQPVTLKAKSFCGETWAGASYSWRQIEGPEVKASVSSWTGRAFSFTTRKLEEVRPLPDEPQILSVSHDQAGEYVFEVKAYSQAGDVAKDYVLVTSTNVAGGMNSVPPYDTYYVVAPKQGPWSWKIATQGPDPVWPTDWPMALADTDSRAAAVSFLPPFRLYESAKASVTESNSGEIFSFNIGPWNLVERTCGDAGCHVRLQREWENTLHAKTWRRLLDGDIKPERGPVAESCATCHSLGYDPSSSGTNGGYDDVAEQYKLAIPDEPKAGTYASLPTAVKEVSGVYCLACHGASRVDPPNYPQPGRFAVGVCARCHDRRPEQDLVWQWSSSRMAQTIKGEPNGPEARLECARCHVGQSFYYDRFALGRTPSQKTALLMCCENSAPITCQICHSPMYATNQFQLFRYGSAKADSGLVVEKAGSGAICVLCHNTAHDTQTRAPLDARLAPHSPQADLSAGRAGYVLEAPSTYPLPAGASCSQPRGNLEVGCTTCHMHKGPVPTSATNIDPSYRKVGDHTFRVLSSEGVPNVAPCQTCHPDRQSFDPRARHDYDGNGRAEGVREEVEGLMALLRTRLAAAIAARGYQSCGSTPRPGVWFKSGFRHEIVVVDALGLDLGDCDKSGATERLEQPFIFPEADLLLHKAAYNYLLIEADKSRGLHNLPYVVSLLQRTIYAIAGGKNLPPWIHYQPPPNSAWTASPRDGGAG